MKKTYQIFFRNESEKWEQYTKHEKVYRLFENAVKHATDLYVLRKTNVFVIDEEGNYPVVFNPSSIR